MPKAAAVHSSRPDDKKVYPDNSACTERASNEPQYLRAGSGALPLCERCAALNRKRK